MAAIADAIGAVVAFIFEILVWSFIGFWKLCYAVFSKKHRAQVVEQWRRGSKDRVTMVANVAFWIPVFAVGFVLGLPLAYNVVTGRSEGIAPEEPMTGHAEIVLSHPKDGEKELVVRVDRSRLPEIRDTKDIPDLVKKLREISVVEERKKPNKTPEPTPGPVTPHAPSSTSK